MTPPTDPRDARIAALEKQIAMLKQAGDFIAAVASSDQKRCDELSIENATLEAELAPFRAAQAKYKDACAHLKEAQCCDAAIDGLIRAALAENEGLRADGERLDWLAEHLAYLMMVNSLNNVMYSLPNKGRGWKDGELRAAINAAREKGGG